MFLCRLLDRLIPPTLGSCCKHQKGSNEALKPSWGLKTARVHGACQPLSSDRATSGAHTGPPPALKKRDQGRWTHGLVGCPSQWNFDVQAVGSSRPVLQCSFYSYKALHHSLLVRHERIHTAIFLTSALAAPSALCTRCTSRTICACTQASTPYWCGQCQRMFATASRLASHALGHRTWQDMAVATQWAGKAHSGAAGRRPFYARGETFHCECCEYTTRHKWNMVVHVRTHTGERPFRCALCPKSFSRKNVLEEHVHTHTGARPFRCSLCPVAFAHKNSLVTHLKRHVGERPFACPECGRAFAGRFALNRHLMAHARPPPPE
ncbi:uncharacterized protein LOC144106643 isoform X2 [Amblyomma americanum]